MSRDRTRAAVRRARRLLQGPQPGWSDDRLVQECLGGNEDGWSALVEKYKNLIYSIPIRYGADPEDAADIFQSVCVELFSELPRLRKAAALRAWLITITAHQAFHWKRKHRVQADRERAETEPPDVASGGLVPPDMMEALERDQMVRDATARLSPRCREMIRLLFYVEPPLPYREVAQRLGLATGSIGFIRGRCLQKLLKNLQELGFS